MLHACHSSPRTHHSPRVWLSTSADATTYRIHTLKTARAAAPAATLSRPASLRGSIAVSHFGMHPCPTRLPARTCLAELCAKSRGRETGGGARRVAYPGAEDKTLVLVADDDGVLDGRICTQNLPSGERERATGADNSQQGPRFRENTPPLSCCTTHPLSCCAWQCAA